MIAANSPTFTMNYKSDLIAGENPPHSPSLTLLTLACSIVSEDQLW